MVKPQRPLHLPSFFPYQLSILQGHVSDIVGRYYRQTYGMTRNAWRVMAALALRGGMSAKEIGQFVQLEKMPISRAIKELKAMEFVAQKTDLEDRRLIRLELTEKGLEAYEDIVPNVLEQQEEVLLGLNEEERASLIKMTDKLLKHVKTLPNTLSLD
ncbi:MarR family transcriptional regulator [Pseudomaricurvus alkylphenolicus]|jgi:DNA-binding MarR family transcriptional regulator|uniref:MarR family winged helix-turn-helix transcriptional regulator n=1 Tax=Pseudomaricurvus alkylphenolicus TaxID=1306991 RepID=UPI00141EA388|nr:winged helix DNA-binding protein [Pseudomaricurvus alkylphenolicus]NIB41043.1 MarR family transcriptional regulator [Pseudomaricurvus alkylphenolicus]